jgi:2-polyprenyl-3-methyl-5-hydroxy-6-metoxy-1,4-benzoquinol methylase
MPWSELVRHRRRMEERFGEIHDLPIARRVDAAVLSAIPAGARVLEVGAGDRSFGEKLARRDPSASYLSMDVDRSTKQDFYDLAEAPGAQGAIVAIEVVEHLPFDAILPWLQSIASKLEPGGLAILSTPNIYHPPAYLRDATHRTPLAFDELGALLEAAGLGVVSVHRIFHGSLARRASRWMLSWLFRILGLDYAKHIVVVAMRG